MVYIKAALNSWCPEEELQWLFLNGMYAAKHVHVIEELSPCPQDN